MKKDNGMIYPPKGDEEKLGIIKDFILPRAQERETYFPRDFRLNDAVIDAVAKKYQTEYPAAESEEERFLVGATARDLARGAAGCPYMKMASKFLADKEIKNVVAIHLIDQSSTEENRQKFLLLTKEHFWLRDGEPSPSFTMFEYEKVIFTKEGVIWKEFTGRTDVVLNYELNEDFLSFVNEFLLLYHAKDISVSIRHPMMGWQEHDSEKKADIEERKEYLHFLVNSATAGNCLTADIFLRIEYLARVFQLSSDDLRDWLRETVGEKKLKTRLREILSWDLSESQRYALFQDILEVCVKNDRQGKTQRGLMDYLAKNGNIYAGKEFVENFSEYIQCRRTMDEYLLKAWLGLKGTPTAGAGDKYFETLHDMLEYNESIGAKILDIGVSIYGK